MKIETKIGTIKAKKSTLNELSIICHWASDYAKEKGYDGFTNSWQNISSDIYNALDEIGYY